MSPIKVHLLSDPDRRCLWSRSRGFSLIELLVCVSILGIVSSLAAPSLGAMYQNYQMKAVARQLVTDLQLARMRAISQKLDYKVTFDGANNRYRVMQGATVIFTRNISDYSRGVSLADNFTNDLVIFSPTGLASGTGTTTFSASGLTSTRVMVTPVGGVYVQ